MALVKFQQTIFSGGSRVMVAAGTVAIKLPGTNTAATVYTTAAATTPKTNPLTADNAGNVSCYIVPGRYDLVITVGSEVRTVADFEIAQARPPMVVDAVGAGPYQLLDADNGKVKTFANGSGATATVPASMPIGWHAFAINTTGAMNFAFGTDTELNSATSVPAGTLACVLKISATVWLIVGASS